jgi:enoyl-CoA hydratase
MQAFPGIAITVANHVGELCLNSPETLNCFDHELHVNFVAALRQLRQNNEVRAIVVSALGKVFSAGGNFAYVKWLSETPDARKDVYQISHDLFATLTSLPLPVIAALHADAYGIGATIVTACDIVVAAESARLGDPHVVVGLCAGDGGIASWSNSIGLMRAKRHLLTGDPIGAVEAHRLGLVTDLVASPEQVRDEALRIAAKIAALPPAAVQGTKRAFVRLMQDAGMAAFEIALGNEVHCLETDDLREAIAAAKEKRRGNYTGR